MGCGWLGLPLANKLIKDGFIVNGSTTSTEKIEKLKDYGISPFLIKLSDLQSNLSDFLATETLIITSPSKDLTEYKKLLQFIDKSSVKKVLFISSTSVYENSQDLITEESTLQDLALVSIENLFKNHPALSTTIVRFAGLIGPNRSPASFFPKGKIIPNPTGYVNMIHQHDCIDIIEQIIQKQVWNETFNACADSHPTRKEFYTAIMENNRKETPVFGEIDDSRKKIISNEKLKKSLEFKFKVNELMDLNL